MWDLRWLAAASGGDEELKQYWNEIAVVTIFAVVLLHIGRVELDDALENKRHTREVVESCYKELMILGLVAFAIFAIEANSPTLLPEGAKHDFEIIHMLLFIVSLLYSFSIVLIMMFSREISRRWEVYEGLEFNSQRYKTEKQQHRALARELNLKTEAVSLSSWAKLKAAVTHPFKYRRWSTLGEHVSFHEIRRHFISSCELPSNFKFVTYLKGCKQHTARKLVDIRPGMWLSMALIASLDLYLQGLASQYGARRDLRDFILISSIAVLLMSIAIYAKTSSIYDTLMHSSQIVKPTKLAAVSEEPQRQTDTAALVDHISSRHRQLELRVGGVDGSGVADEMWVFDAGLEVNFEQAEDGFLQNPRRYFPLGQPDLILNTLQFMQFILSLDVGLLIQFGSTMKEESLGAALACVIIAVIIYFVTLAHIIVQFTMITSVGKMVDRERLSEALKKQKHRYRTPTHRTVRISALVAEIEEQSRLTVKEKIARLLRRPIIDDLFVAIASVDFFIIALGVEGMENGSTYAWTEVANYVACIVYAIEALAVVYAHIPDYDADGGSSVIPLRSSEKLIIASALCRGLATVTFVFTSAKADDIAAIVSYACQAVSLLRILPHRFIMRGGVVPLTERQRKDLLLDSARRHETIKHHVEEPLLPMNARPASPPLARQPSALIMPPLSMSLPDIAEVSSVATISPSREEAVRMGLEEVFAEENGIDGSAHSLPRRRSTDALQESLSLPTEEPLALSGGDIDKGNIVPAAAPKRAHGLPHTVSHKMVSLLGSIHGRKKPAGEAGGLLSHSTIHGGGSVSFVRDRTSARTGAAATGRPLEARSQHRYRQGDDETKARTVAIMSVAKDEVALRYLAKLTWSRTCIAHPDVVAQHGRHSEQILRLMLGQPAPPRPADAAVSDDNSSTDESGDSEEDKDRHEAEELGLMSASLHRVGSQRRLSTVVVDTEEPRVGQAGSFS